MLGHNMLEESQRESGFSSHAYGVRFSRIYHPRWLATLRSPGANFLHASGVQTSSPEGCEAIPGVIETLYTDAR